MNFKIGDKLHLGCGEQYKKGYVNVDYPRSEHSISRPKVDLEADILKLDYGIGILSEVRLHHVFEHFVRHEQMVLMSKWSVGLGLGGKLIIEVPDFEECLREWLKGSEERRMKIIRHVEGSQEQHWAVHYSQMWEMRLRNMLQRFGFGNIGVEKSVLVGLPNIIISGEKMVEMNVERVSRELLSQFLVNGREKELLEYWMGKYGECMK